MMWGKGILTYIDQRTYKGSFENDNRHGYGELIYPERHSLGKSMHGTKKLKMINHINKTEGETKEEPKKDITKVDTTKERKEEQNTQKKSVFSSFHKDVQDADRPGSAVHKDPSKSVLLSTAVDAASAANLLAANICHAKALLVPRFAPPSGLGGVLKYRGDWGTYGGEIYSGPFVNDLEHGEAQWVVPMGTAISKMVRRGTWIEGERLDWLSYPISLEQTKAFVDAFHTPKTFIGLHAEMIADGFPHLPDGVDNTDPAVKMIVGGILRANSKTAGMFQNLKK